MPIVTNTTINTFVSTITPFVTEVDDRSEVQKIKISPNPTTELITISFSDYGNADLTLTSIQGELIQNKTIVNGITTLNLQGLKEGLYIVTIKKSNGQKAVSKLVVKH